MVTVAVLICVAEASIWSCAAATVAAETAAALCGSRGGGSGGGSSGGGGTGRSGGRATAAAGIAAAEEEEAAVGIVARIGAIPLVTRLPPAPLPPALLPPRGAAALAAVVVTALEPELDSSSGALAASRSPRGDTSGSRPTTVERFRDPGALTARERAASTGVWGGLGGNWRCCWEKEISRSRVSFFLRSSLATFSLSLSLSKTNT